ncbi:nascent polypeptide-associated complex protein [Archaeoglobus veneficus]|uniref:Nascent polypeptide-associated complex protein n=1 Tax=Archaeoglobus veneficus (strain DSM 11195 / SNP6) TaxID=693661 RepID=F2KN18_ARCVS|nr:nascent polypeptide-associated complex protein [Archaeoglobus veneficus]AEA47294.1 Nascent polypeptide-associated complex protein [Archaeoglobus veneficus SNP6]
MFPANPNQLKKMMKQMGINMEEIAAEEVIIRTRSEELVFKNPTVTKIAAKGMETFQIVGSYEVIERKPPISEEDVKLIMEQAGVSEEVARKALEEANGDLAEALLKLQE